MFFAKLRNNMRWVIILIAVTFVIGGLYVGTGIVTTQTSEAGPALAEVNGRTISEAQFQRAYANNVQLYSQFFGPIQGQMLEEVMYVSLQDLITDVLVREAAAEADLPVSNAEIDEELAELKAGFPDEATYNMALAQSGLTERQLRELLREELAVQKLEQSIRARAELSEEELEGVDEEMAASLRRAAEDEAVRRWLDELHEAADILIHDPQLQARDLFVKGEYDEAAEYYRLAMVSDPFNPYLHVSLANVLEEMGRSEDALAEYEAAAELNEEDPMLHVLLGLAYREAERDEEAAERFRTAGELNPWDAQLQMLLLQLFTEMDLAEDAEEAAARLDELSRLQQELEGDSELDADASELEGVLPEDVGVDGEDRAEDGEAGDDD